MAFNGQATQEQVDAWNTAYGKIYIPRGLELKSVSIVPFRQQPAASADLIKASSEFVAGFVPPDYLVDGVLQRRFCYSLTAQTGVGKTTVAMMLAAHVATGRSLHGLDVAKGTVLYFAGENPYVAQYAAEHNLPQAATLGGAETMYPEFRNVIKTQPKAVYPPPSAAQPAAPATAAPARGGATTPTAPPAGGRGGRGQ